MSGATPTLDPRPGDYAGMLTLAAAKRRARRRRGAAGALPAALVAVWALALPHGAGTASLRPADPPARTTAPTPAPTRAPAVVPSPARSFAPSAVPSPAAGSAPATGAAATSVALPYGPRPVVTPGPVAPPTSGAPTSAPPTAPTSAPPTTSAPPATATPTPSATPTSDSPATYRYLSGASPGDCLQRSGGGTACGVYAGPDTFTPGVASALPVRLCVAVTGVPLVIQPPSNGRWVWAWAAAGPGPYPWTWEAPSPPDQTVTVQPGDCAEWAMPFDARDDQGRPLPKGNYVLDFSFYGTGSSGTDWLGGFDVV